MPELSKAHSTRISLSPDARVVAVSVDLEESSSIFVYPTASDAERISIIDIHRGVFLSFSLSHATHTHTHTHSPPPPTHTPLSILLSHTLLTLLSEVTDLCWEPTSLYLISAAKDRHIRVWYNILGQKELIRELQEKLPKASSEPLKVVQFKFYAMYQKHVAPASHHVYKALSL